MNKMRLKVVFLLLTIIGLSACGGGETGNDQDFTVLSVIPANNATDVSVETNIEVEFSHDLQEQTITTDSVWLEDPNAIPVIGSLEINGTSVTFQPESALSYNTLYTARISRDVASAANGSLPSNFSYAFTTEALLDTKAPSVQTTSPLAGSASVAPNVSITVTFDEPIKVATLTGVTFSELNPVTNEVVTNVPFNISYTHGKTVTLIPRGDLAINGLFEVKLTGITDDAGNTLTDYRWTFNTGNELDQVKPVVVQTTPNAAATDIPVTRDIEASFSEPMDANSITSNQFTMREVVSGASVIGTVSYENQIATFSVKQSGGVLKSDTEYQVNINGVKDLAGNTLDPFNWRFTTLAAEETPPEVASVVFVQLENNSGVNPESVIEIIFSESLYEPSVTNDVVSLGAGLTGSSYLAEPNKIIFTPSVPLAEKTEFTLVINSEIQDESLNNMTQDYSQVFTTGDKTPPTVNATSPASGAEGVAKNAQISLSLSEPLTAPNQQNFLQVSYDGGSIPGNITVSGSTVSFQPAAVFPANTEITIVANTNIVDLAGNALVQDFTWSFSTSDFLAPVPVTYSPAINAVNVATGSDISVTFGANEIIQASTATSESFKLINTTTGLAVDAVVTAATNKITLTPVNPLEEKTSYQVKLSKDVEIIGGINIANDYDWTFITEDITKPAVVGAPKFNKSNGNIITNTKIEITFSEEVDEVSLANAVSVKDEQGVLVFIGLVTLSDNKKTINFKPINALIEQATYTIELSSNILDLYGNALESYDYGFEVGDFTAPKVLVDTLSPAIDETNVGVNKQITLTFDEAMDEQSTIDAFSISPAVAGDVSVVGSALTFVPTEEYAQEIPYTVTIANTAQDQNGNALQDPYSWSFTVGDFIDPQITSVFPVDGEQRAALGTVISVVFDDVMDEALTEAAISVRSQSGDLISGTIALISNSTSNTSELRFTPDNLEEQESYTVTVANTAADESPNENTIGQALSWVFRVGDYTAPNTAVYVAPVPSSSPQDYNQISLTPTWSVNFGENLVVNNGAFELYRSQDNQPVTFNFTPGQKYDFNVLGALDEKTEYIFKINKENIADAEGNTLDIPGEQTEYIIETGDWTSPTATILVPTENNFTNIPSWTITFSEQVILADGKSEAEVFTLFEDGTNSNEPLKFAWGSNAQGQVVLTIDLDTGVKPVLPDNTPFTIAIDRFSVTDLVGRPVSVLGDFGFTVGDHTSPTLRLNSPTSPANGATNVARNTDIKIYFSEAINEISAKAQGNIEVSYFDGSSKQVIPGAIEVFSNLVEFYLPTDSVNNIIPLPNQTQINVKLTSGITDEVGNSFGERSFSFTTGDEEAAKVKSISPIFGAVNQERDNLELIIEFDESMDTQTIVTASAFAFTLDGSSTNLQLGQPVWTVNSDGVANAKVSFVITDTLQSEGEYTATYNGSVLDLGGNQFNSTVEWSFKVGDFIQPNAVSQSEGTDDLRGLNNYTANSFPNNLAPIFLRFSESMDTTATESAFSMADSSGNYIEGDFAWSESNTKLTFTPLNLRDSFGNVLLGGGQLAQSTPYTVNIAASALDDSTRANNLSVEYSFVVTTGDQIRPTILSIEAPNKASNDKTISRTPTLTVLFSEKVDNSTIVDGTAFALVKDGGGVVTLSKTLLTDNRTLELVPNSELESLTSYELSFVGDEIKDTSRNQNGLDLLNSVVTKATVNIGDWTKPWITGISQTALENGKTPTQRPDITVTFNEDMNTEYLATDFTLALSSDALATVDLEIVVGSAHNQSVTLRPLSDLDSATDYTFTVKTDGVTDPAGNFIDLSNSNPTTGTLVVNAGDWTPPEVDGLLSVPALVNGRMPSQTPLITVAFTDDMDATTLIAANFTLREKLTPANTVAVSVDTITTNSVTLLTDVMTSETDYELVISGNVTDTAGNALAAYTSEVINVGDWNKPLIHSVSPFDGDSVLSTTSSITINFSEPVNYTSESLQLTLSGVLVATTLDTPALLPTTSLTYNVDAGVLTENALYSVVFNAGIADVSLNPSNVSESWQFTTGSNTQSSTLNKATFDLSVEFNGSTNVEVAEFFVIQGLISEARYAVKLTEASNLLNGLDLETYADAFNSKTCVSDDSSTSNELCVSKANNAGEIYVKLLNPGTDIIPYTLDLKAVSSNVDTFSTVLQGEVEYLELSVEDAKSYFVNLSSQADINLYVFNDVGGELNDACRSLDVSAGNVEYCESSSTSTSIKVLLDASSVTELTAQYSIDLVSNPSATSDISLGTLSSEIIGSSGVNVYRLTGLTGGETYTVEVNSFIDGVSNAVTLQGYDNGLLTADCDLVGNDTVACFAISHQNKDEMLIEVSGLAGATFNLVTSGPEVFSTLKTPSSMLPKTHASLSQSASGAQYRLSQLAANAQYMVQLSVLSGSSITLSTYLDEFVSSASCSISDSATNMFCIATSNSLGEVFVETTGASGVEYDLYIEPVTVAPSIDVSVDLAYSSMPTTLNAGGFYYYKFTGLDTSELVTYSVALSTDADGSNEDFDLYVYSDSYTTSECASTTASTGSELCDAIPNASGELFIIVDTSFASDLSSSAVDITFTSN